MVMVLECRSHTPDPTCIHSSDTGCLLDAKHRLGAWDTGECTVVPGPPREVLAGPCSPTVTGALQNGMEGLCLRTWAATARNLALSGLLSG